MKAAQMAECLQKIAPRLEESEAVKLRLLSSAVGREGGKPFVPYCTKVEKALQGLGIIAADSSAASMLRWMGDIALVAGASSQSKDFFAASRLVIALGATDAGEISTSIDRALAPKPKKPTRPVTTASIDPRSAADQLTAVCHDSARFEILLKEVSKMSKPVLAKVAEHFLGFSRGYKSKDEITKAIRARQLQDAIDGSREAHGAKIAI